MKCRRRNQFENGCWSIDLRPDDLQWKQIKILCSIWSVHFRFKSIDLEQIDPSIMINFHALNSTEYFPHNRIRCMFRQKIKSNEQRKFQSLISSSHVFGSAPHASLSRLIVIGLSPSMNTGYNKKKLTNPRKSINYLKLTNRISNG